MISKPPPVPPFLPVSKGALPPPPSCLFLISSKNASISREDFLGAPAVEEEEVDGGRGGRPEEDDLKSLALDEDEVDNTEES
jgi:hypothetical protein